MATWATPTLARAQEPAATPAPEAAAAKPDAAPITALRVGTVHTVTGGTIQDGRILVQGGRILGVGPASELELPEGVEEIAYPDGHAYPGFVDALSDAFVDPSAAQDRSSDAGSDITEGLDPFQELPRSLVEAGITTLYATNTGDAQWRGLGAALRLGKDGFSIYDPAQQALSMRLTSGPSPSHPLDRIKALEAPQAAFKALEAYEKALADHAEALEKYEKDFKAWIDHHQGQKKDAGGDAATGSEPAAGAPDNAGGGDGDAAGRRQGGRRRGGVRPGGTGGTPGGTPGGRPGRPTGGTPGGQDPTPAPATPAAAPAEPPAAEAKAASKDDKGKAPERPKYPKAVDRDPAKDALLAVVRDKRPLRIEAHRVDEIRAALELARDEGVQRLVLENASAGDRIADEIARAGVPVVVTDLMPGSVPKTYGEVGDDEMAEGALPARLHAAGVAVAIASGSARGGRFLPMVAAWAAGQGMPEDAALRAITQTPAEILGLGGQVGSLEKGKHADVVITSGSLFASGSRVLRVLAGGETAYEAK